MSGSGNGRPGGLGGAWPSAGHEVDLAGPGSALREGGAGMALAVAIGIKASAGILLPIMLLGIRRSRRLLAGAVLGVVIVGGATLYAFGPHLPNLADQERLVVGTGLPNLLGYALGLGGETSGLHDVLTGVLIVAVVVCSVWAWRTRDWLRPATAAMLVLLLTLSWELPWYVYWLLPLAALARSRALRAAALVLGLYLLLAWIPLMTDVIKGLNFRPTASALGEQNARLTKRLLH